MDSLEDYRLNDIISKSIQNVNQNEERKKVILIDDVIIYNETDFNNIIENFYSHEVLGKLFSDNTKIHIKLKLNLREYLIITNLLYPTFIKCK